MQIFCSLFSFNNTVARPSPSFWFSKLPQSISTVVFSRREAVVLEQKVNRLTSVSARKLWMVSRFNGADVKPLIS